MTHQPDTRLRWMINYNSLAARVAAGEDPNVPQADPEHGIWVQTQRRLYYTGKMPAYRQVRLEAIGLRWRSYPSWIGSYLILKRHVRNGGKANVPRGFLPGMADNWMRNQRRFYAKGKLERRKILLLERLGFEWRLHLPWIEVYLALKKRVRAGENPNLERSDTVHGNWLRNQRVAYKNGKLGRRKTLLLERLGVDWYPPMGRRIRPK